MKESLKYPLNLRKNYFYVQLIEIFTNLSIDKINSNKTNSLLVLDEVSCFLKNAFVEAKMIEQKNMVVATMIKEREY